MFARFQKSCLMTQDIVYDNIMHICVFASVWWSRRADDGPKFTMLWDHPNIRAALLKTTNSRSREALALRKDGSFSIRGLHIMVCELPIINTLEDHGLWVAIRQYIRGSWSESALSGSSSLSSQLQFFF